MTRLLRTPFVLAVLGCVLLAGWAVWSGGIFDGPIAEEVRTSSVYAAPGAEVDEAAAERVIGNRRLVVVFLDRGADLAQGCDEVEAAADGNVVLLLGPGDGEFEHYGCALLPGGDENFGNKYVAEATVARGVDQFAGDPLTALKVVAVNYDLLVNAGIVPNGARTISPSPPRYLLAIAAIAAVLGGAPLAYFGARRLGRLAAGHRERRDAATDAREALNARAAVLAGRIIALDRVHPGAANARRVKRYRKLVAAYADLVTDFADADERGDLDPALGKRVDDLTERAEALAKAQD